MNDLFAQVNFLYKGLDAAWLRNEVIADNIANAETPGFKRSFVEFESLLQSNISDNAELKTTRDNHIKTVSGDVQPKIRQDQKTTVRMDGNNVDIEYEMNELAKNTIWYQYMIQKVSKEIGRLKLVINEGR